MSKSTGGCTGGNPILAQPCNGGSVINLSPSSHEIIIDVSGGTVRGLLSSAVVYPSDIVAVVISSSRVGRNVDSVARTVFVYDGVSQFVSVVVDGTANNDVVKYSLELQNGSYEDFNINLWLVSGMVWSPTSDNEVQYGLQMENNVDFYCQGDKNNIKVDFGSSIISGLQRYGIDPADVDLVILNSNNCGWSSTSTCTGNLEADVDGNQYSIINSVPNADLGYFSVRLFDGTYISFRITEWTYTSSESGAIVTVIGSPIWKINFDIPC